MRDWTTGVLLAMSVLTAGCPNERSSAPDSNTRGESKTKTGDSPPARTTDPSQPDDSKSVAPPPLARVDRIQKGTVLRPHPAVSVGLVEVERQPEPLARLSVGQGPYAFSAVARKGDRVHVFGGELELVALSPPAAVEVRWLSLVPKDVTERPQAVTLEQPLRLAAMGLYRLPDGRVLGVGNVRRVTALGAKPRTGVTLALFPRGYAADPTVGYDRHEDVGAGARLSGKVGRLKLERVAPTDRGNRGAVLLRIR